MPEGKIKLYNSKRGFGFIGPLNGRADVFFHFTGFTDQKEVKQIEQGAIVTYGIKEAERGPEACEILLMKTSV